MPLERGAGFAFEDRSSPADIPPEFVPAIREGVEESTERGALADFPLVDLGVRLLGGSWHEVDSSEMSFKIASSMAFSDAVTKASPVLLEPIMALEVTMPEEYLGAVINDLNGRRGKVSTMEMRGGAQVVAAEVPLAAMFGYATDLRSATQGRATYSMQYDHLEAVPANIVDDVVRKIRGY